MTLYQYDNGKYMQHVLASENGLLRSEILAFINKGGIYVPNDLGVVTTKANEEVAKYNESDQTELDPQNTPTLYVLDKLLKVICSKDYSNHFPEILSSQEMFLYEIGQAVVFVESTFSDKQEVIDFEEAFTNMVVSLGFGRNAGR
jgi:hypothetical protein